MTIHRHIPPNMPKDPDKRWPEARKMAASGDPIVCNFSGWDFPYDKEKIWFKGANFVSGTTFDCAEFADHTSFEGATFEGKSIWTGARFGRWTLFQGAEFGDTGQFDNATFGNETSFECARFRVLGSFVEATFGFRTNFQGAKFGSGAEFDRVKFESGTGFQRADFGLGSFNSALFEGDTSFEFARFEDSARFDGAKFGERTGFEGVKFGRSTWFPNAKFEGDVSFIAAHFPGIVDLLAVQCEGEVHLADRDNSDGKVARFDNHHMAERVFRFAKKVAQDRGNYAMAGEYHFGEQCAIERQLVWWKQGLRWLIGRCIFGYGEKPFRSLLAAAFVILLWTFIYMGGGVHGGDPLRICEPATSFGWQFCENFGRSLYFSVVTFTTLGYGDFQPGTPWVRGVAAAEALSGALLMATFIVVLSRKYMR